MRVAEPGWSSGAFLGEARRTLTSRPFSFLVVVLILVGAGLGAGALDMTAWRDAHNLQVTQESLGSLVIRISAGDDSATVSAAACLQLGASTGVRAAGGVGAGTLMHTSTSPGLGFRVLPAVGQVARVLAGTGAAAVPAGPGVVIADDLASQMGLAAGSWAVIDGALTTVAAVLPLGRRDPRMGRVALSPGAPAAGLTACYVEFADAYAMQALAGQLPGLFAATANLQLKRMFATGTGIPDPQRLWSARPARYLYLPLGIGAALIYLLVVRARRNEHAIYLVTGASRPEAALMILICGHALVLASLGISAAWLALLARLWQVPGYGLQLGLLAAARAHLVALAALPLSIGWLARANLHRLLRERTS
ncbi:MAG: hypothetical protein LBQ06_04435 [Frankiaceae bacterium]|jgi:hypothetical protein|nr:hypothetical protein [Frankiaceae bacterium]